MSNIEKANFDQIKGLLNAESTKRKFIDILGKKAVGFISSVINVVGSNQLLAKANPTSVVMSAAIAATLDLPINPNLGFAAIVPYGGAAQFQMMWRGFVQLAQRSGQYRTINTTEVYEGEIKSINRFTGDIEFDPNGKKSDMIIGYVAYFSLINGFEKYFYMTKEEVENHGKKYSKSYSKATGRWQLDFNAMAKKTVLKLLLSRYGIMSVDMQKAVEFDQSAVKGTLSDLDSATPEYVDNDVENATYEDVSETKEEDVEKMKQEAQNDIKKAEILLAQGVISLDEFNEILDKNM